MAKASRITSLVIAIFFAVPAIAAEPPVTSADADPVLIQGAGVAVRKSDYDLELQNVPPDQRIEFRTQLPRIQRMLEKIFLNKVLLAEARKTGFDKDPKVVAELRYLMETRLAQIYANQLTANIPLPDLEPKLREQYKLEVGKYREPEKVQASHILISTKKNSKDEARKIAEEVHAKAVAGEPFKDLALKYSEDPSAHRNQGDLGYFTETQMVAPFSKAAFALKTPGEISPVVESDFGFHVIRFEGRVAARTPSYEELRPGFLETAARDYRGFQINEIYAKLLKNQAPKADDAEVEKLRLKIDINKLIEDSKPAQK